MILACDRHHVEDEFGGMSEVPLDADEWAPFEIDIETYKRNLTPLWTAEKIGDLTTRKMPRIALMGDPDIDPSARPAQLEEIDSIQNHIDDLIDQLNRLGHGR